MVGWIAGAPLEGCHLGFLTQMQSDAPQGWSHLKAPLSWMCTLMSDASAEIAGTAWGLAERFSL